jgi:ABC-type transport system involved in Fe-S cluster assembly fused permease/ATPase subunit
MFEFIKLCKALTILKLLWPYLWSADRKLKRKLIFSIAFNTFAITSSISTPILFAYIIDYYNSPISMSLFLALLVIYVGIWSFGKIFLYLREMIMFPVMERAIHLLISSLFNHIQLLPFKYHLKRKTGEITGVIESAIHSFPPIVWSLAFALCPLVIESICVMGIVTAICGISYALVLVICLVFYVMIMRWGFSQVITPLRQANRSHLEVTSKIVDSLFNFSSIKYFSAYDFEAQKIEEALKIRELKITDSLFKGQMIRVYQTIMLSLSFLLLMVFTGYNLIHNKLSLGEFIMIHTYMLQFTLPLEGFGQIFQMLNQSFARMEKALDFLAIPLETKRESIVIDKEKPLHIVFKDVWFGYKKDSPILKGVSFELRPNQTLAIVGESGSGKSTIISLLLKFNVPCKGQIFINGEDLENIDQESLLNVIGIVPQDVTLFNNTLSYNILYADRSANNEMLMKSIEIANLSKTIHKLPDGLKTIVGERGAQLSGGEKQRIGLARAIIRQPKLYIFDEATSSLDSKTEKNIIKNIEKIASNSSTLIIAHRLSTIAFADQIILLENGIIKKQSYETLMQEYDFSEN